MTTKIHWLFSGQVVTAHRNGTENRKLLNVMVLTDDVKITRKDLDKAQQGLAQRFVTECTQIPGFKIVDVYIENFGLLGEMTPEEFNDGYDQGVQAAGGLN